MKPYPKWACAPCGAKHGTKKAVLKYQDDWSYGKCEVCGKNAMLTDPEEYGNFINWFNKTKK
jgi:hypothetical protein